MRIAATVANRIWLVVGLCLGVGATAISALTYELAATSNCTHLDLYSF